MSKTKASQGKAENLFDGNFNTDINIKNKDDPWATAQVPKSEEPHRVEIYNTRSGNALDLEGVEVFLGDKKGDKGLDIKCGGPFYDVSNDPLVAICPGHSKYRYVTAILLGEGQTLNIAEMVVSVQEGLQ